MASRVTTVLSRLRSADADLSNPKHDLACRYVALPRIAERLIRPFLRPPREEKSNFSMAYHWRGTLFTQFAGLCKPTLHSLLRKQDGRFNTPIGYVDVILPYVYEIRRVGGRRRFFGDDGEHGDWERDPLGEWSPIRCTLVVEVKIQPISVGEV